MISINNVMKLIYVQLSVPNINENVFLYVLLSLGASTYVMNITNNGMKQKQIETYTNLNIMYISLMNFYFKDLFMNGISLPLLTYLIGNLISFFNLFSLNVEKYQSST